MSTQDEKERLELLQETLDLLILRRLIFGPLQGQGIALTILHTSERELLVEQGRFTPRCNDWNSAAGSRRSGEPRQTTAG
jgi:hypothetical protein